MDRIKKWLFSHKEGLKNVLLLSKYDTFLVGLFVINVGITGITPFVDLYLIANIIDEIMINEYKDAITWILILAFVNFFLGSIKDYITCEVSFRAKRLQEKIANEISIKALCIDYDILENPETLKGLSNAKYAIEHTGGYYQFLLYYNEFASEVFKIVSSFLGIMSFFLLPSVAEGESQVWFLHSYFLLFVFFIATIGSGYLYSKIAVNSKRHSKELFETKIKVERQFDYYIDRIFMNFEIGKEIRLYKMKELIREKYIEHLHIAKKFFEEFYHVKEKNKVSYTLAINGLYTVLAYVLILLKVSTSVVSVGEIMKYAGMLTLMNTALGRTIELDQLLQLQLEYVKVIQTFLGIKSKYENAKATVEKEQNEHIVEFHNVSFRYSEKEEYVIKNVSVTFGLHKNIAIVGTNGSGKSTFIKLMCRLYEPTEGYITYNGKNIKEINSKDFNDIFSVVFQDYQLFDTTIEENIAGSEKVNHEKLKKAIEDIELSKTIEKFPKGVETSISLMEQGGVKLSGGESQKVAIARAIYKKSKFIILDEPTAALDPESEYEIFSNMKKITKHRTGIFVSHRMSSCQFCDDIIVMNTGEIVQKGNHNELMKQREGQYYSLYMAQKNHYA